MFLPLRALLATLGAGLLAIGAGLYVGAAAQDRPVATDQLARGRGLYEQHCVRCHAQGGTAPELTAEALAPMGTAQTLFSFVRVAMPQDRPGTLTEQEYWDILAHLLAANGFLPPGVRLSPATAERIRLAK